MAKRGNIWPLLQFPSGNAAAATLDGGEVSQKNRIFHSNAYSINKYESQLKVNKTK